MRPRGRNDTFYAQDSGTVLSGQAREQIAQKTGNNVDFSQRYADGLGDSDEADRIVRALMRIPGLEHMEMWRDPDKLKRFTDGVRNELSGYNTTPEEDARLRQETPERPFNSEEFWSNPEEVQQAARTVRPRKL